MKKHSPSPASVNRRELLKQAGAAALVSAIGAARSSLALTPSDGATPRIRETFDFGWKFNRGDFPDAQKPEFSDSGWKSLDLPHDWSIESASLCQRLTKTNSSPSSLMASIKTARCGSTANIWANALTDMSRFSTTSHHTLLSDART